ncbi:Ankycorbin [Morella rubra]|uniref:Ankycorbin n=1 Tax=Morella rubra TaxID=262757 RepID=A0A6A1UKP8_9ROSI|nr:Ankycorbin [Morella rubra]
MAKDRNLVRTALTGEGDTVLHIAVTGKCSDFIRKLVDFMEPDEMLTVNKNSDTGLHMAAVSGMLQVARLIVVKNKKLLLLRGKDDLMPLAMAIQGGHRSLVKYLHEETELDNLADEEYICLVLDSLSSKLYGTALKLVRKGKQWLVNVIARLKKQLCTCWLKRLQQLKLSAMCSSKSGKDSTLMRHELTWYQSYCLLVRIYSNPRYKISMNKFYVFTIEYRSKVFTCPMELILSYLLVRWNYLYRNKPANYKFNLFLKVAYFSNSELAESDNREEVLVKILNLVMKIQSDQDIKDLIRRPSSVIFDATMSGNVQFLAELLRKYPELLWEKDERGRSVFHVAIVYRQENVFNLIYNTGAVKDYLVGIEDSDGNNMLHLAGMTSKNKEKLSRFRANLLMQQEILWFKEVEKIVRPDQRNKKNSRGKTPREVFIKRHRRLLRGGEDTIKGTAKSCMLVATLIATVVFAAPLNVQGMNSPSKKLQSWIFALSNAAALCSSTSSIVVSLSILTSSYAQSDFLDSLHRRLIIALTTLFVSIATMVAAFGAAMFVIFDHVPLLFMFTIILFAGLPVWLFLMVHGNLFADLIRSYRWSKSLFKPSVHKIFV